MTVSTLSAPTAAATAPTKGAAPRWTMQAARELFELPFSDLIFRAQTAHRTHFDPNEVQMSTLLSIKTGGCAENCGYCSQSSHFETGLKASKLMALNEVKTAAAQAKAGGAQRFCMGAAWREPKDRDIDTICEMVQEVKALGMETCMTLGMLSPSQAKRLAEAGLDYYNHNIDTGP
jgi:biotin synthase